MVGGSSPPGPTILRTSVKIINVNDLFKINYKNHTSYDHINPSLLAKLKNNLKFIIFFLISSISIVFLNKYPKKDKNKVLATRTQKFFQDGVSSYNDNDLKKFLKELLKKKIETIEENLNKVPIRERSISDCIIGVKKTKNKKIFKKIEEKIFEQKEFNEILMSFFSNKKPKLVHFNIHVNRSDDIYVFKHDDDDIFDDDMNFFHVDTNLNTLKAMVYLTDVSSEKNGGFEYVIGSQNLFSYKDFIIRKIIRRIGAYRRDEKGKNILMSLFPFMRKSNDFSDYDKSSKLCCYIKSKKRLFAGKDNVIIFDPLGIHRGGRVKEGKRIALQLVFCVDNYSWRMI